MHSIPQNHVALMWMRHLGWSHLSAQWEHVKISCFHVRENTFLECQQTAMSFWSFPLNWGVIQQMLEWCHFIITLMGKKNWFPARTTVCVEFACSPHVFMGFLPHPKDVHVGWTGVSKLCQSENEWPWDGRVGLCVVSWAARTGYSHQKPWTEISELNYLIFINLS